MTNLSQKFQLVVGIALIGLLAGAPPNARAADLNIADSPLFVATNVEPNVMFTLDDSGSMQWEIMPDPVFFAYLMPQANNPYGGVTYGQNIPRFRDNYNLNLRTRNPQINGVFYNPEFDYQPWSNPDGSLFPNADPDSALRNPRRPGNGALDLDSLNTWGNWSGGGPNDTGSNNDFWPITFYMYDGAGNIDSPNNYTKFQIREDQAFTATPADAPMVPLAQFNWPGPTTRTIEEEKQNFANWFTYHRSRVLTSWGAIGRAFTQMPDQARVGFAAINQGGNNVDGVFSNRALISGVRQFDAAGRGTFYNQLYGRVINNFGTPLRTAAEAVGEYFERSDARGPWSTTPGVNGGDDLACRQSFQILMSDGFWNGGSPGIGNSDGTAGPTITGPDVGAGPQSFTYTAGNPFADGRSNTLADVAMHYWKRDLRTDLENRVSTTAEDPAFWQHLTSFGIGLGVSGTVDPVDAFNAVENGTPIPWGNPGTNPGKIDDLLHFGVNGRGGFFSAADPETFATQLGDLLLEIVARTAATTGLSVSTTRLTQDSVAFAAEFDSEDWSGEVKAIDVLNGSTDWTASPDLNSRDPNFRDIYTSEMDGSGGVDFDTGLSGPHKSLVDSDVSRANKIIRYVRGEDITGFRDRDNILGDIVNSRPVFVGQSNEGWANLSAGQGGGSSYFSFVESKESKTDAVYLGANDGMLHAFNADNGDELFGFVPRAVFSKLGELTKDPYAHQFFVDGQQVVRDAHDGSWKRVLVGTLGAGGRGVYAIDVTDANNPEILWEMNSDDDDDIGFTFGEPIITRLGDNDWVAIFGNGYNSDDNDAVLYVVDLFSGNLRDKIVLETSSDSNGLSGVAPLLDPETRLFTRRIYAGDLQGTIWRVDFDDSGSASVKYGNGLFTDPDNRPITSAPELALRASGGVFVYFGTGKLIEPQDRLTSSQEMERLYAIIDRENALNNPDLGEPEINNLGGGDREIIGDQGDDGWVIDLSPNASPTGERALARPVVVLGRVVFTTFEPEDDPCAPGGVQRLYLVNAFTGSGELPSCQNCGVVEIGIGAPIVPPIVIGEPPTNDPTDDSSNPFVPPDPADLPDGTSVGVISGWCRQVMTLNPATGQPLAIGPICDGRQAWRQRTYN